MLVVRCDLIMCKRVHLAKAEVRANALWGLMPKGVPSKRLPSRLIPSQPNAQIAILHLQLSCIASCPTSIAPMARKAAQKAPAASPLDGCTVATSGRFPGGVTQSTLQARLTSLGAVFASGVSADTTHLIVTEKDFGSNSTKVKAASAHNVPVVTLHWLDECETTGESHVNHVLLKRHKHLGMA